MSIISEFLERSQIKENEKKSEGALPLKTYENGTAVYEEEVISFISDELSRRRKEREPFELQWRLNSNFLLGHQNCDINPYRYEVEDRDIQYEYQERSCYNRIAPIIDTRLANLDVMHFEMTVNPATNEMEDYEKAIVSTKILQYLKSTSDFDTVRKMLVNWSELCGTAFILSWWDRDAGDVIGECERVNSDGEKFVLKLHEGDVKYGLLTPYEVYPESIYKQTVADQKSIIVEQVMSAADVFETYGVSINGREVETYALTPTEGGGGFGYPNTDFSLSYRYVSDSVKVVTYFERPTRTYPEGRLIITAEDKVLFYGDLPYDDIPIVCLKCRDIPGQFFGRSVIQELIPLQRAYNGCKNKIHDYIRTLASNPLLVPEGSVDDIEALVSCGTAPGTVIEYNADRGKPSPLIFQSISSEVRAECEDIVREMEYVAGVSQLMVTGANPGGVTSGTAIEKLQSIDSTRLSITADSIRSAVKSLALLWLKMYKRHAKTCRILSITGKNDISSAFTWTGDDINSYDVTFDTENELKNSEQKQKENFLYAMSLGLFSDEDGKLPRDFKERAIEMLRLGAYGTLMSENELQMQNARRENNLIVEGRMPECDIYDDDVIHLSEHKRFALQMRFKLLRAKNPELASQFDRHVKEHALRISKNESK